MRLMEYAGVPSFLPLPNIGHVHRIDDDMDDSEGVHVCTHPACGQVKPITEFYVRTNGKRDNYCKACQGADRVRRRAAKKKKAPCRT